MPIATTPLEKRFWSKVDKTEGCWIWSGAAQRYGKIRQGGQGSKHVSAHKYAFEEKYGAVPEGLELDHTCHTQECTSYPCIHLRCVNPDHLKPVTHIENLMRGVSPSAINARKTHCLRGHEFSPANTYIHYRRGRQTRHCRACMKIRGQKVRA